MKKWKTRLLAVAGILSTGLILGCAKKADVNEGMDSRAGVESTHDVTENAGSEDAAQNESVKETDNVTEEEAVPAIQEDADMSESLTNGAGISEKTDKEKEKSQQDEEEEDSEALIREYRKLPHEGGAVALYGIRALYGVEAPDVRFKKM